MDTENTDRFDNIISQFLTRGESVNWDELRKELNKEEYALVKERLLQLNGKRLEADHERIWLGVQRDLALQARRRRVLRWSRYAAIFLLPVCLLLLLMLNRRELSIPERVAVVESTDMVEVHKAYLVLDGGARIELSAPRVDTIRQDDGKALAVDTLGTLVYNTVKAEVEELSYHTIVVPRGGEYALVLSDGSRVRLNADSELRFPIHFASGERKVFLKGEAYFEVEHDTKRPFRVEVRGDANVEVLGTKFNINAYPENERIFTTLVQGSVKVEDLQSDAEVILMPNQQASLSRGEIDVKEVDAEDYITWINGRFYFERMSLVEIVLQLERWYDLQVFWSSEDLKLHEFTGAVWRDNSIQETLDRIEKTTAVHFTVSGRTVTVNAAI